MSFPQKYYYSVCFVMGDFTHPMLTKKHRKNDSERETNSTLTSS